MAVSIVIAYLSLGATCLCFKFNFTEEKSTLVAAVAGVFKSSIAVNNYSPTVLSISDGLNDNSYLNDFCNEILLSVENLNIAVHNENIDPYKKLQDRKRQLLLIVIENFTQFLTVYSNISPKTFKFNGFIIITLLKGHVPEVQEMFGLLWKLQIVNINVMFCDKHGSVKVETFMPFNEIACDDTTPIVINEFKGSKFVKGVANLFPEKTHNLHNCPIKVSTSNDSTPSILAQRLQNGTYRLDGRDIKLLKTLSEIIRFSINYTFIGPEGFFLANGTSEGPFKALYEGEADISISKWWLKENRIKFFDFTNAYIIDQVSFIVPPGSELTPFEKLIFPFSYNVWIGIFVIFVIGFCVILIVKKKSKISQEFVFGTAVKTPFFNMIIAFLGGTQTILPKGNFPRTLLMIFLMYTLVIRTLYQAGYYELMQSSIKHKEVQSIDEMLAKGFTFLTLPLTADVFQGSDLIGKRFEIHF